MQTYLFFGNMRQKLFKGNCSIVIFVMQFQLPLGAIDQSVQSLPPVPNVELLEANFPILRVPI